MSTAEAIVDGLARQFALGDLYQDYANCLDSGSIERWPDFFTDDGIYRAQGRENHDRGLPLAVMWCEGRGMLRDRVTIITRVMVHAPRTIRHVTSAPQVREARDGWARSTASFCVFHTLPHEPTALLSVGRYEDIVTAPDGNWKFRERLAIYDSLLIPNSLVYPL